MVYIFLCPAKIAKNPGTPSPEAYSSTPSSSLPFQRYFLVSLTIIPLKKINESRYGKLDGPENFSPFMKLS